MGRGTTTATTPSRRAFLAGAAAAVGWSASGCGAAGSGAGGAELRFYMQKTEVIDYFTDLLRRFEAETPGTTAVLDSTVSIAPQFVRGDPGDVGCFNNNLELARYLRRGVLSDLSDLPSAGRIRQDISALTDQYATYPGRTSVLPYSLTAAGVIYNQQVFDERGLPVPTTWTEFTDVCTALQRDGVTPIYATDRDAWTLWQGLFDYSVGSLVDTGDFFARMKEAGEDVGPGSGVSFEEGLAEPMERARAVSSFFNPDHAVRNYADGNLAFGTGQAAMYLQGPWALGQIALVDPDLPVGTFALPLTEDPADTQVRVNIDLGLWVPTGTSQTGAARQLVEFLMQPEVINAYNLDNLAYPTTTDGPAQEDPRLAGLQQYVDDAAFYQGAGTFVPASIPLGNYVQAAISSGDFTSMLRQLDADWRRLAVRGGLV